MREFRFDAYMQDLGGTFRLKDPPQIQWYKPGEGFYAYHTTQHKYLLTGWLSWT